MKQAYQEAVALLDNPEHFWAAEAIRFYLDLKDFAKGTTLRDLTKWGHACCSAIRSGSGGLLGNPPLL